MLLAQFGPKIYSKDPRGSATLLVDQLCKLIRKAAKRLYPANFSYGHRHD